MNFLTGAFLQHKQYRNYSANLYLDHSAFGKIAKFSNAAPDLPAETGRKTSLKLRRISVLDRAFIFAKALMATTSAQTFGPKGKRDTYINLNLPGDLNIEDSSAFEKQVALWTHLLTDFAASDSLDIYKGIRYWRWEKSGKEQELYTPLYHANPYLIGKEVFDVPAKVSLFNESCWHIRNGIGKLTIEGKKLVLVINCSVYWFRGGNADVQMKIITEACAQFILAYILRGVFKNVT